MPMHLPTVRMGLIPQHVVPAPYGALAFQSNPGHYGGVRWAYKGKKVAQCKGYADAVNEYEKQKRALVNAGCNVFAIFPKSKCKPYRNKMQAAEKKGKAAWKTCKAYSKGEEKGYVQVDTSGGYTNVASTGAGMGIDPLTGLPVDPTAASYGQETQEEPSNMGLWLGVGALVLATGGLIIYKRKKGKKGKKGTKGRKKK